MTTTQYLDRPSGRLAYERPVTRTVRWSCPPGMGDLRSTFDGLAGGSPPKAPGW
jgi:hypothetical protein